MSIVKPETSRVAEETQIPTAALEEMSVEPAETKPLHEEPVPEMGSGTINLNLSGVYSPEQLIEGVTWKVSDFDVGELPSGRVLVDRITSEAIGSNVSANLMVSANLFNTAGKQHYMAAGVKNTKGWVTSAYQDELVPLGFAPIVSLMPNEYTRQATTHYQPASSVDDGLMQRYGHLSTGNSLRENIVPFPGEDYYYVAKDHVVLDIIERNWDALGQDVTSDRVREGNWIKVSTKLVDKVLDELNSKVLRHMPLTNINKLQFQMRADPDLAEHLDDEQEYPVSLTLSVQYRSIAPELSA